MALPLNFPLSFNKLINNAIQQGRGAAAQAIAQPYNVFRNPTVITGQASAVNNAVLSASPIITNFPALIGRTTSRQVIENAVFDLLVYEAICNNLYLQLQDVIQEVGFGSDGGVYTFAQARPMRPTLWVRTESNCSITRPFPEGGAAAQMPVSGNFAPTGYAGIPKQNEQVLTLVNGFYSFAASGTATPASVQCGIQPQNKIKDGRTLGTPTDLYREFFAIYVPDLPGELLGEMDRISSSQGDRYEVALVFNTQMTGLSGNVCVCERLSV